MNTASIHVYTVMNLPSRNLPHEKSTCTWLIHQKPPSTWLASKLCYETIIYPRESLCSSHCQSLNTHHTTQHHSDTHISHAFMMSSGYASDITLHNLFMPDIPITDQRSSALSARYHHTLHFPATFQPSIHLPRISASSHESANQSHICDSIWPNSFHSQNTIVINTKTRVQNTTFELFTSPTWEHRLLRSAQT